MTKLSSFSEKGTDNRRLSSSCSFWITDWNHCEPIVSMVPNIMGRKECASGYSYLGRSVRVDRYHVFYALFDFELDVELPLQGGDALLVG